MTLRRRERIHDVLAKRQQDLTVLAEEVHKPHNLSAILRSCDAVGIGTVHAVKPTGGVATFSATSASADKWVDLVVHPDIATAVATMKASGKRIYAAHLSADAVDYRAVDYTVPCAVLLGNEKDGVSRRAAELADQHVIIPMLGMVQSLNVSVAAAVILFEAQRQRLAAGMYDRPSLSERELRELTLRWLPRWATLEEVEPPLTGLTDDID
ncbi:MAG: tRNA (guanosine(18)-2'-O)-methyltransferase TrmH [Trueperaceae bacterium]|nr:tRNA (guanosine(18)-2'-O)-methyltransferase TrmH [Trueperaceae bacterium]MCO5174840.1 tRNA (guanosine(18)-2'-O)-methyltransferase TrmH [Trueperaceae bacterium]MCW5818608.1 tRNA (guanosine(18)-2'-O)-methyltransferase TrmH [Trueperaceae bacterium]